MQHIYDRPKLVQRISDQVLSKEPLYDMKHYEYNVADASNSAPNCISDSEEDEPIRQTRVSLMIDDLSLQNDLHMSLLHSTTVRQTSKPTAPTIPMNADVVRAVRPPPVPTSAPPSTSAFAPRSGSSSAESASTVAESGDSYSTLSSQPTARPQFQPTSKPSAQSASKPSFQPTTKPSSQPTTKPFSQPSTKPSSQPTTKPSSQLPSIPTASPATSSPSFSQPSVAPTSAPRPSLNAQLLAEIRESGVGQESLLNDRGA